MILKRLRPRISIKWRKGRLKRIRDEIEIERN